MRFDPVLAAQLWALAKKESDANRRGELLEFLVGYLFVSQASYGARMRARALDAEFDLILRAEEPSTRLHAELGTYVLVECKNTKDPTGSSQLRNFSAKVRYAGCTSGVLVTRAGLTGTLSQAVANATYAVRKAYHRDGTVLVVLSSQDIEAVVSGEQRFDDLLERRYEEIRFDLPAG